MNVTQRSARLSNRERQVLDELARGSRTEEMADALYLSTHTVRSHVKTLLRKLGARTRAHAVAIAFADGALEIRA
jgi:DNA-binding CsgD family transcriptional regulator